MNKIYLILIFVLVVAGCDRVERITFVDENKHEITCDGNKPSKFIVIRKLKTGEEIEEIFIVDNSIDSVVIGQRAGYMNAYVDHYKVLIFCKDQQKPYIVIPKIQISDLIRYDETSIVYNYYYIVNKSYYQNIE